MLSRKNRTRGSETTVTVIEDPYSLRKSGAEVEFVAFQVRVPHSWAGVGGLQVVLGLVIGFRNRLGQINLNLEFSEVSPPSHFECTRLPLILGRGGFPPVLHGQKTLDPSILEQEKKNPNRSLFDWLFSQEVYSRVLRIPSIRFPKLSQMLGHKENHLTCSNPCNNQPKTP